MERVWSLKTHLCFFHTISVFLSECFHLTWSVTVFGCCTRWSPGSCSLLPPTVHTPTMSSGAVTLWWIIYTFFTSHNPGHHSAMHFNTSQCSPAVVGTVRQSHTEGWKLQHLDDHHHHSEDCLCAAHTGSLGELSVLSTNYWKRPFVINNIVFVFSYVFSLCYWKWN